MVCCSAGSSWCACGARNPLHGPSLSKREKFGGLFPKCAFALDQFRLVGEKGLVERRATSAREKTALFQTRNGFSRVSRGCSEGEHFVVSGQERELVRSGHGRGGPERQPRFFEPVRELVNGRRRNARVNRGRERLERANSPAILGECARARCACVGGSVGICATGRRLRAAPGAARRRVSRPPTPQRQYRVGIVRI